eukprot:5443213-Pyramimonas_sp.AAC.1
MVTIEEVYLGGRRAATRLVAAWQASELYEGSDDQRLWLTVSLDSEGRRWLPAQPIPGRAPHGHEAPITPLYHWRIQFSPQYFARHGH